MCYFWPGRQLRSIWHKNGKCRTILHRIHFYYIVYTYWLLTAHGPGDRVYDIMLVLTACVFITVFKSHSLADLLLYWRTRQTEQLIFALREHGNGQRLKDSGLEKWDLLEDFICRRSGSFGSGLVGTLLEKQGVAWHLSYKSVQRPPMIETDWISYIFTGRMDEGEKDGLL